MALNGKSEGKPKRKLGKVYPTNETIIKHVASKAVQVPVQSSIAGDSKSLSRQNDAVIKQLLSKCRHHNVSIRKEALSNLCDISSSWSMTEWSSYGAAIVLPSLLKLALDTDRNIRAFLLQKVILATPNVFPFSPIVLAPFLPWIMTVFSLGLTHLQQDVAQDIVLYIIAFIKQVPTIFQPAQHMEILRKIQSSLLPRFGNQHKTLKLILIYLKQLLYSLKVEESRVESHIYTWKPNSAPIMIMYPYNLDLCVFNQESDTLDQASQTVDSKKVKFVSITSQFRYKWINDLEQFASKDDPSLGTLNSIDIDHVLNRFISEWFIEQK
jgi:hypothetical protein